MTPDQVIGDYLAEVAAALPGPRRTHASVVAEMRAGLLDAADAHAAAGLPAADAAQAAVRDFGRPSQIAEALRPEVAISYARRTAVALIAIASATGLLWLVAAVGSRLAVRLAPPWEWPGLTPAAQLAVHLAAGASVLAVLAALVTLAATGRLTRWLPATAARRVTGTAATACLAGLMANLAAGGMLASQLTEAPRTLDAFPVTIAAAASLAGAAAAHRAARHCLATTPAGRRARRPHPPRRRLTS